MKLYQNTFRIQRKVGKYFAPYCQYNMTLTKLSKSLQPINTRQKLADIAGVSEDTYAKGAKILNSKNETLKNEVLSGHKSINAGYNELTAKETVPKPKSTQSVISQTKICMTCGIEKPNIDFYGVDEFVNSDTTNKAAREMFPTLY